MRLIDADAMNKELFFRQAGGKDSFITVEKAFEMVELQPTIKMSKKVIVEVEVEEDADIGLIQKGIEIALNSLNVQHNITSTKEYKRTVFEYCKEEQKNG